MEKGGRKTRRVDTRLRDRRSAAESCWRHLFKSMARHVGMDREVEGFITGHSTGKTSADYGPRWTKTLAQEIAKYPRFRIAALTQPPTPHKRIRRTRAQIEADNATKEALRARRRAA
jgi:hypothetical protein